MRLELIAEEQCLQPTPNDVLQLTLAVAGRLAAPSRPATASAAERWC